MWDLRKQDFYEVEVVVQCLTLNCNALIQLLMTIRTLKVLYCTLVQNILQLVSTGGTRGSTIPGALESNETDVLPRILY